MDQAQFKKSVQDLIKQQERLLVRGNRKSAGGNGIFDRYEFPVLTAAHAPIVWRYDLDRKTNPFLMERIGVNAAFNAGALLHEGKFLVAVRVEGADRKSFFAIAESPNGIDNFLGLPHPDARNRRPRHQRLRHAPGQARGRLDLRPLLH
jgi:4-O-beta-D-mannosyl-D-glucose phosphorylase